jgi:hypothetical protein
VQVAVLDNYQSVALSIGMRDGRGPKVRAIREERLPVAHLAAHAKSVWRQEWPSELVGQRIVARDARR